MGTRWLEGMFLGFHSQSKTHIVAAFIRHAIRSITGSVTSTFRSAHSRSMPLICIEGSPGSARAQQRARERERVSRGRSAGRGAHGHREHGALALARVSASACTLVLIKER